MDMNMKCLRCKFKQNFIMKIWEKKHNYDTRLYPKLVLNKLMVT
jgi:hypothetical protein